MSAEDLPTESYHGPQPDDRLDAILADYLQEIEEGRPPNRELLLARHPDLAEELREFFADRDSMKWHANRLRFIVPESLGDYKLLEEIGSGTFGVVVKARHIKLDKLVAIKLLRGEQWSSPEYVRRFETEARKAARLDHPHIVPVNHVGQHAGQHYYEMKLIEGGSLIQRLCRCTSGERSTGRHQRWAAELMAKIAHAVHHAHQHAIIHRDLKPGNILLDAAGQPHITDFGLAKQLEEGEQLFEFRGAEEVSTERERFGWEGGPEADTVLTEKGLIAGTAPYMSPEQASGQELSTASDVYSLGVVLYEMLTGQVPIRGATPQETIKLVQRQPPSPPRSLNPRIDCRLEKICLKCLRQNPEDRYGSALGLARNLQRWLSHRPLIDPPDRVAERIRLACRRNPVIAGLLVTAAALFVFVSMMVVWLSRVRAERLEEEVLKSNAYAAQGVASTILWQFGEWASAVHGASESTDLRQLLEKDDREGLRQFIEQTQRSADGLHFESWYLLNGEGDLVACTPEMTTHIGKNFKGRDYFLGACDQADQRGLDSVYVSRAFRSFSDGKYRIGFARAVRDNRQPNRPIVGVIEGSITTDETMGIPQLHDERHKAVLVGPEDPNPIPSAGVLRSNLPERYLILLHKDYEHGKEPIPMDMEPFGGLPKPSSAKQLSLPDASWGGPRQGMNANYLDPAAQDLPQYGGRWLAGCAPVGNTSYVVIVQQRYAEAIPSDHGIIWSGVAVLLGAFFIVAIGWFGFRWSARSGE